MPVAPLFPAGDARNRHVILDEELIDIEALAQRYMSYIKVTTQESEYLRQYPVQRDEIIARLSQSPRVSKKLDPYAIIPLDSNVNPDQYLDTVDEMLRKPPLILEDHVIHFNLAGTAILIFAEYTTSWGLLAFPKLREVLQERIGRLSQECFWGLAANRETLRPPTTIAAPANAVATAHQFQTTQVPTSSSPVQDLSISPEQIESWLSHPTNNDFVSCKFSAIEVEGCEWHLVGIMIKQGGMEFQVEMVFTEGSCIMLMGSTALQELLQKSVVAGVWG